MILIRFIYFIYCALTFVLVMLLVVPVVVVALFLPDPASGNLIYKACNIWADIWCFLIGFRYKAINAGGLPPQTPCIFVANHISYTDVPAMMKTLRLPFRALGKEEMKKIPIFGFIYRHAVVMVNRSDAAHRADSVARLKAVLSKGISILIFPEGTFNETGQPLKSFYDGAFRIAIETQTPIQPLVLVDTLDRMHYNRLLSLNPGKIRTVWLEPISVEGLTLRDVPMVKEKVILAMSDCLAQYHTFPRD